MTTPSGTATGTYNDTAGGGATGETGAFTPSGNNRLLLVLVVSSDGTPANVAANGVKYGGSSGTPLTQVGNYLTYGTYFRASLWRLIAPAASSNTVHVTWAANQGEKIIIARAYQDVDQSTPLGTSVEATGTSQTAAVNGIGAAAADLIADFAALGDVAASSVNLAPAASQNEVVQVSTTPSYDVAALDELVAGGTSVNRSQSLDGGVNKPWGMFGVAVKEIAAGGAVQPPRSMHQFRLRRAA